MVSTIHEYWIQTNFPFETVMVIVRPSIRSAKYIAIHQYLHITEHVLMSYFFNRVVVSGHKKAITSESNDILIRIDAEDINVFELYSLFKTMFEETKDIPISIFESEQKLVIEEDRCRCRYLPGDPMTILTRNKKVIYKPSVIKDFLVKVFVPKNISIVFLGKYNKIHASKVTMPKRVFYSAIDKSFLNKRITLKTDMINPVFTYIQLYKFDTAIDLHILLYTIRDSFNLTMRKIFYPTLYSSPFQFKVLVISDDENFLVTRFSVPRAVKNFTPIKFVTPVMFEERVKVSKVITKKNINELLEDIVLYQKNIIIDDKSIIEEIDKTVVTYQQYVSNSYYVIFETNYS